VARLLLATAAVALVGCGTHGRLRLTHRRRLESVTADNAESDRACLECHTGKATFEQTAHHLTSTLPASTSVAGHFGPGQNVLLTSSPYLHFRMDSTKAGFHQTAIMGRPPDTTSRSERFAFVVGSGRKGQSYLYWGPNDRLYQLPVSYWTSLGKWINSPGYVDGNVNFDRPVTPRCLECHATSFESVPGLNVANQYQRTGMILGVTCESCHTSGREHVTRERSPLRAVLPSEIVNPARLPRERQLDQCALCHGGLGTLRTEAFSYVPGQQLAQHLELRIPSPDEPVDVHGNQVALLERSRCFRSSQMTCATCHDVHRPQRDVVALSNKCLTCHTVQSCGLAPLHNQTLVGRCVDCHMPKLTSNTIVSSYNGREERIQVRTHWIKVYPQAKSPPSLLDIPVGK
jgi:hypothetical protein